MGTNWRLAAAVSGPEREARLRERVEDQCADIIRQMSQWEADSEINRFNAAAADTAHRLSTDFAKVLGAALSVAADSDGAFDPTLGAASEAWGFGAVATIFPERAGQGGDWRRLTFDVETCTLRQPGGVKLDLSGIAKGYAVDALCTVLHDEGVESALVEIGGELSGFGIKPDGLPWWVDIEAAPGAAAGGSRIALCGWSVATSGDWQRRRSQGVRSWSHTLSPASGSPIERGARAATVLHPSCMYADALATVLMVLPLRSARAFAESRDVAARIITHEGETKVSVRWQAFAAAEGEVIP